MILPFSTHFPKDKGSLSGKPTFFMEKIYASLMFDNLVVAFRNSDGHVELRQLSTELEKFLKLKNIKGIQISDFVPKRHTIRKNSGERFKHGTKIHASLYVRTKKQFQFAPIFICKRTQSIEIVWSKENSYDVDVYINGKECSYETICQLAKNDGFDSMADFFEYFNEDFYGSIIHWTDFRY